VARRPVAIRMLIKSFSRSGREMVRISFIGPRARMRSKSIISAGCTCKFGIFFQRDLRTDQNSSFPRQRPRSRFSIQHQELAPIGMRVDGRR
jgi:hypothetical protein